MAISFIIGNKIGMTRIFNDRGTDFPVTILEAGPCIVSQVKTTENDGYSAVQIGFQDKSKRHVIKAEKGHFENSAASVKNYLKECQIDCLSRFSQSKKKGGRGGSHQAATPRLWQKVPGDLVVPRTSIWFNFTLNLYIHITSSH